MHLHLLVTQTPFAKAAATSHAYLPMAGELLRQAPITSRLLSRANRSADTGRDLESALCQWFNADAISCIAAYTALADGIEVGPDYWLRVDPVHHAPGRDELSVIAITDLERDEVSAYLAEINAFLRPEGLEVVSGAPHRWYLRLPGTPDLATTSLPAMHGRPMGTGLPKGSDAGLWLRRMTEVQMLLHTHATNMVREARGVLPVSGIWPWGGGALPPTPLTPSGPAYGADVLLRGLMCHADSTVHPAPAGFTALPSCPRALVQLDSGTSLAELDSNWMASIGNAIREGTLRSCEVELPWVSFTLRRPHLWRFWRRPSVALFHLGKV